MRKQGSEGDGTDGKRGETSGETSLRLVRLYSDGACRGNPGVGGFAAIVNCDEHEKEVHGAEARTTNNRMELRAAIAGLTLLKERCHVKAVTDSQYVMKGMTEWLAGWIANGWRTGARKSVLNRDLWEELNRLCHFHKVEWEWTRGHAGHSLNERCDELANAAIDEFLGNER